jgi:hypothetical protein
MALSEPIEPEYHIALLPIAGPTKGSPRRISRQKAERFSARSEFAECAIGISYHLMAETTQFLNWRVHNVFPT